MNKGSGNVSINEFVLRQVKGSGKTYANNLTFDEIASHAQVQLNKGHFTEGYRDGVILVQVAKKLIHHFICPFVKVTEETKLKATVVRRRTEEKPYIQIRALNGIPLKTGNVDFILYHHDILAETNEQTKDSDWELISFHAIPDGIEKMPIGTVTMMRNQIQLPGGTKGFYESEKWAKAVKFWQEYATLEEK